MLRGKLLAEHSGLFFGQYLRLLHRRAGRRQAFDEGAGVEDCRGLACNVARAVGLGK
jgi:hypothetical protein